MSECKRRYFEAKLFSSLAYAIWLIWPLVLLAQPSASDVCQTVVSCSAPNVRTLTEHIMVSKWKVGWDQVPENSADECLVTVDLVIRTCPTATGLIHYVDIVGFCSPCATISFVDILNKLSYRFLGFARAVNDDPLDLVVGNPETVSVVFAVRYCLSRVYCSSGVFCMRSCACVPYDNPELGTIDFCNQCCGVVVSLVRAECAYRWVRASRLQYSWESVMPWLTCSNFEATPTSGCGSEETPVIVEDCSAVACDYFDLKQP